MNTKKIKELFENIQTTIEPLLESFIEASIASDAWHVKKLYIPEVVLTYISVVQTAAYFTNREVATKAMDIATVIAEPEKEWLQAAFLETERMTELVETLASVSRAMLRMAELEGKGRAGKKKGAKGESLKIWNVNVRN